MHNPIIKTKEIAYSSEFPVPVPTEVAEPSEINLSGAQRSNSASRFNIPLTALPAQRADTVATG
jgi:hypothetical protein